MWCGREESRASSTRPHRIPQNRIRVVYYSLSCSITPQVVAGTANRKGGQGGGRWRGHNTSFRRLRSSPSAPASMQMVGACGCTSAPMVGGNGSLGLQFTAGDVRWASGRQQKSRSKKLGSLPNSGGAFPGKEVIRSRSERNSAGMPSATFTACPISRTTPSKAARRNSRATAGRDGGFRPSDCISAQAWKSPHR